MGGLVKRYVQRGEAMHMLRKGQVEECKKGESVKQAGFVHRVLTRAA